MKLKKFSIVLVCLPLLFLNGCFPSGEKEILKEDPNNSTNIVISGSDDPGSIPASVDLELEENLTVKADVSAPDNLKLKNVSISLKQFDVDKAINTFIDGKTISETHEWDNALVSSYKEKSFICEDKSSLGVYLGGIYYNTAYYKGREYNDVIFDSSYVRPEIKDVYKQSELEQVNKDTAISTVKQAITSLGITVSDTPDVVALDLETLKSEWKDDWVPETKTPPRQWEKADEAYVVIFHAFYDDVPISNIGYISTNGSVPVIGSRIIGVVTKDGLIYFQCSGIYEVGNIIKDSITPISLSTALEQIKEKYKNVLLTDPVNISHIALEYVPQVSMSSDSVSFELIPAWVFTTSQTTTVQDEKGSFEHTSNFPIILNAESGQELPIGGLQ